MIDFRRALLCKGLLCCGPLYHWLDISFEEAKNWESSEIAAKQTNKKVIIKQLSLATLRSGDLFLLLTASLIWQFNFI